MNSPNQAANLSNQSPQPAQAPDERSRYLRKDERQAPITKYRELYSKGQHPIYHKLPRGVDPKPYTVSAVLGDGQYHLERDGKSDGKVYLEEDLQTEL